MLWQGHRLLQLKNPWSHLRWKVGGWDSLGPTQGLVSRKTRKRFGPEKTFVTLRPAYSGKLVFSYVVKAIKIIITAKFRAPRRLPNVTRNAPEKFRDF